MWGKGRTSSENFVVCVCVSFVIFWRVDGRDTYPLKHGAKACVYVCVRACVCECVVCVCRTKLRSCAI